MTDSAASDLSMAVHDFWRARRRANLQEALSYLAGNSKALLPYEEVRRKLRAVEAPTQLLEDVPLDAIVGSVGRYNDFTRGFLPRQDSDKDRWAGVLRAVRGMEGVPPIEVYRIGDAYFVKDGNHRVSVARQLGVKYIQAYVTPVRTRVPLAPDVDADELIIKAEYADFLEETQLDELRPGMDLTVTVPGQYGKLLEHISVHRYFMGIDEDREVSYPEAVAHWYDTVYLPVVGSIRSNGLLRGFEGRTETDLYLWLADHRSMLEQELGWSLSPQAVASGLGGKPKLSPERREQVLRDAAGQQGGERICEDILVALANDERGFEALEQALVVARREGSRLYGLHVVEREEELHGEEVAALRAAFEARCRESGVACHFAPAVGTVIERLLERATWSDLVVTSLPCDEQGRVELSSTLRSFLRHSPRPVLAVPERAAQVRRVLLAYDGRSRADTALFLSAYLAARWQVPLVVLCVAEFGLVPGSTLQRAREYLSSHDIDARYLESRGAVPDAIVQAADEHDCDAIVMGSYKYNRWLETVLGGVLDDVLRRSGRPVLVT